MFGGKALRWAMELLLIAHNMVDFLDNEVHFN